jgi:hypothetical protein
VRAVFHVEFAFAGRTLRNQHDTLCAAIANARHILANWQTVRRVTVLGSRRDGYPIITIVSRN